MQKFCVENVKSFQKSEKIEMKPITVFVGKNSCGKSSLIRFPVVLAQTFKEDTASPILLYGKMIDYGNFDDVVFKHGVEKIGFRLSFGIELASYVRRDSRVIRRHRGDDELQKYLSSVKMQLTELSVEISKPQKRMEVESIILSFDDHEVCRIERIRDRRYKFRLLKVFDKENWKSYNAEVVDAIIEFEHFVPVIDEDNLIMIIGEEREMFHSDTQKAEDMFYGIGSQFSEFVTGNIVDEKKAEFTTCYYTLSIVGGYLRSIRQQMLREAAELSYIGPFRENPQRTYRDSESSYYEVGVNGENTSMILRQAAQENKELLSDVSQWFHKEMGYELKITDADNGYYSLIFEGNGEKDNIMDVGYGMSQILPIVTQLYNKNSRIESNAYGNRISINDKRTIVIEQPEIHLHPAAQASLADLFVNCVSEKNNRTNKILIETHSEHLIRKLQVLVADPDVSIDNDQIAIYYVDKDEAGRSYTKKMELCENGQFAEAWPSGFFDKNYELTKELIRASSKVDQMKGS